MSGSVFSLVFDRKLAGEVFKQVGEREIVLAALAGMAPEPGWEGCLVYAGDPPGDRAAQACIGISGPVAETVQQRLVEALERIGITVLELYEGGPEPSQNIAMASGGKWTTPDR